jgi:hypothetical protein
MPDQAEEPVLAGVSLRPTGAHAVVISGRTVTATGLISGGTDELAAALRLASGRPISAVTVDISALLLDAVLREKSDLPTIAVIRVVPRPATDPVLARSPAAAVERIVQRRYTVSGGHDLLGHELCPLDRTALTAVCEQLKRHRIQFVAIVAAGSQARPEHERAVADAVEAAIAGVRISVASDLGGQGLVAREATAALDCALGPLAEQIISNCRQLVDRAAPGAALRVARGDGGYSIASRIGSLPIVAFGATDALELCGAAWLAGLANCRVLLPRPGGQVAGDVRRGLPVIRSPQFAGVGTELVVPTAVLAFQPDADPGLGDQLRRVADVPVIRADRNATELSCIGAAVSHPTSWLDEFAFIESAAELDHIQRDAQERATAIVMANGAAPGSAQVAEVSAVAVPYSPSGTVRIRVRVAGAPDVHATPDGLGNDSRETVAT